MMMNGYAYLTLAVWENSANEDLDRYNPSKLLNYIEKLLEYLFKSSDEHQRYFRIFEIQIKMAYNGNS